MKLARFWITPTDDDEGFDIFIDAASAHENEDWKAAEHVISYMPVGTEGLLHDKETDRPIWFGKVIDENIVTGNFIKK